MEPSSMTSLQNFLWKIEEIPFHDLFFKTSQQWNILEKNSESQLHVHAPEYEGIYVEFDGIANSFPVETFLNYTCVSQIFLEGEFEGNLSFQIWHSVQGEKKLIYEDPLKFRMKDWRSPPIVLKPGMRGRIYLSIKGKGSCSFKNLGWHTDVSFSSSSFQGGFTIYRPEEVFFSLLHNISNYLPLSKIDISFRIINQSGMDYSDRLPDDPRFKIINQLNLGSTGGYMRGLWEAESMADFYFGMTEDALVMHPEMLYRMAAIQLVAKNPLAIGGMNCDRTNPAILLEQGTLIETVNGVGGSWHQFGCGLDLRNEKTLDFLFSEKPCTYLGWWSIMTPVSHTPYLPALFLHYDDMLEGVLLEKSGISRIVPPTVFAWQSMGDNLQGWRAYLEIRNRIAFNFILDLPVRLKKVASWGYESIIRCLQNFDYDLAKIYLMSFKQAANGAEWTIKPEFIGAHLPKCHPYTPSIKDFSGQLSDQSTKNSYEGGLKKKFIILLYFLTLWGYLNPFAKNFDKNGRYFYRKQEVFHDWEIFGYKSILVIDDHNQGYLCKRSLVKMIPLLIGTILTTIKLFIFYNHIKKKYKFFSDDYKKPWTQYFNNLTSNKY
jgi:hypothetical protein